MNIETIELLQPLPVERCVDGYWSHPGVPDIESDPDFKDWMKRQGFEYSIDSLESEGEEHPGWIRYYEAEEGGPGLEWNPAPPDGEGWFALSIHDTEDGPVWIWVRRTAAVAVSS